MQAARVFLWVVAAAFLVFGVAYLFAPASLAGSAGITADPGGLTDLRATYGGFQIGFGIFLIWSALAPARMPTALLATALVVGFVGLCRTVGLLVDSAPSSFHWMGLAFEVPITVLACLIFGRTRSADAAPA